MTEELQTVETIRQEVAPVVQRVQSLTIVTPADYEGAASFLEVVKAGIKRIDKFFAPMVKANLEATRRTNEAKAQLRNPLADAESLLKRKQLDWSTEQEDIRRKVQARLQAKADEWARIERTRLENEAEKLKTPELKAVRLEQAAAIVAPVIEVATVAPVVKGQSIRKTWRAKVVHIALVPREYMVVNDAALQAFARATKGAVKLPGVEMYEDTSLSSTSK